MNITSSSAARGARFRHVVFAARTRCAIDLAPDAVQHPSRLPLWIPPQPRAPGASPPEGSQRPELTGAEAAFIGWMFQSAGMDHHCYRVETLRRRLPACLRLLRAQSPSEARQRVMRDSSLIGPALGTLTIGVTSFFRDAAVFEALAQVVIPSLAACQPGPRVWSAGSSSGEELYSIAILLAEAGLLAGATLLGTDCRAPAIAQARQGTYDAKSLRTVPPHWRQRYFVPCGHDWQVRADLRSAAQWRTGDLTRIMEPGSFDLIIFRNVAIYFRRAVAERVYQLLAEALRPGGVLVLGKAEQPPASTQLRAVARCIYRRQGA